MNLQDSESWLTPTDAAKVLKEQGVSRQAIEEEHA